MEFITHHSKTIPRGTSAPAACSQRLLSAHISVAEVCTGSEYSMSSDMHRARNTCPS